MSNIVVTADDKDKFYAVRENRNVKGVKYIDRIYIPIDSIYADPKDNVVRHSGYSQSHDDNLEFSFAGGILYSESLPIVEKLARPRIFNNKITTYRIIDGYNRLTVFRMLGITHYWFDVVEFGHDGVNPILALIDLQLTCNDPPPSKSNMQDDVVAAVSYLIANNVLKKEEDAIFNYIKQRLPKYSNGKIKNILNKVMAHNGITGNFITYTKSDVKTGVVADRFNITSAGKFDKNRNMYGWTCLQSYEKDFVFGSIMKWYQTQKKSYVAIHVKSPSMQKDLLESRKETYDNLMELQDAIVALGEYTARHKKLPFEVLGFLPQDATDEKAEHDNGQVLPVKEVLPRLPVA
jgi:hypothetical protein